MTKKQLKKYTLPNILPLEIKTAWKAFLENKSRLVQNKDKEYLFSIIEDVADFIVVSVSVISLTKPERGDYVITFSIA